MAQITIGVPVYNGADMLGESLACLARQTRGDFRVLVHDNASTDATPDIVSDWAARDARFTLHRHPTNIGPAANFAGLMAAADTPYFLWRAHDDLSCDNFVARTAGLLDDHPGAMLAATRVRRERVRGGVTTSIREIPFRLTPGAPGTAGFRATLKTMHQSWFYGMWRTEAIRETWGRVFGAYPHAWASDFLILFAALARGGIVGSDNAVFHQRIVAKVSQDRTQAAPTGYAVVADRRRRFYQVACAEVGLAARPWPQRLALAITLDQFTSRRVCSRRRLARAWLRQQWAGR